MFLVPKKYDEIGLKSSTYMHVPEEVRCISNNIYITAHGRSLEILRRWGSQKPTILFWKV